MPRRSRLEEIRLATWVSECCWPLYAQRFALRRFLGCRCEVIFVSTEKSWSLAPAFIFSRSQTGIAPRPAHVFPERSRYLARTFRPFNELPDCFRLGLISSPSRESCLVNSFALRRRATVTSMRSCKRLSTDMLARLGLAMLISGKGHHTHNSWQTPRIRQNIGPCTGKAGCFAR